MLYSSFFIKLTHNKYLLILFFLFSKTSRNFKIDIQKVNKLGFKLYIIRGILIQTRSF